MNEAKLLDVDAFVDEGFLQEANRRFFHPVGLALAVHDEKLITWDMRHLPAGPGFPPEEIDSDAFRAKAKNVLVWYFKFWENRGKLFGGWSRQRIPGFAGEFDREGLDHP